MPNPLCHFAIHADDCDRARQFYSMVFGWAFTPWGPPGFWRILTGQPGVEGALHGRMEPVAGKGMIGFECSIAVEDVDATMAVIEVAGGTILAPPFLLEGVGTMVRFQDPEGNFVTAMQYIPGIYDANAPRDV